MKCVESGFLYDSYSSVSKSRFQISSFTVRVETTLWVRRFDRTYIDESSLI